jgi:hypothetical protein
MNKIISQTKKVLSLSSLAIVLVTGTLSANGGDHKAGKRSHEHKPGSASTAEVVYIGNRGGEPLFNVLYNNNEGGRFSITVLDGLGNTLFTQSYADRKFDKKFTLADDLDTNGKLVFVVRNFSDNSTQSFEINSDTRLVEDVEVKEVK